MDDHWWYILSEHTGAGTLYACGTCFVVYAMIDVPSCKACGAGSRKHTPAVAVEPGLNGGTVYRARCLGCFWSDGPFRHERMAQMAAEGHVNRAEAG